MHNVEIALSIDNRGGGWTGNVCTYSIADVISSCTIYATRKL